MKLRWFAFLIVLLAGCSSKHDYKNPPWNPEVPVKRAMQWMPISEQAGKAWGVSPRLITAIIAVESGGNPTLVSKSNAVGLMQLKASTAGREVYRYMGWKGQPSTSELKNPERNISMGTAYLSILEHGILKGIDGQKDDAGYSDKTGKRLAQLKEEQRLLEQLLMLYKEKSL